MGLISIYNDHGHIYKADTCQPLVQAVENGETGLYAYARGNYPGKCLPKGELKGLKSVGYWDAQGKQNWGLDWHRNEGLEITYLETGSMPFAVQDQDYILKPGDLTFTRPWQPHKVGNPYIGAGRLNWVILDVDVRRPNQSWHWPKWIVLQQDDLEELTNLLRQNESPVWKSTSGVRQCFKKLGQIMKSGRDGKTISKISVYINELILLILDMFHSQNVNLNPSFSGARRTIELFFHDLRTRRDSLQQPWTVEEMAAQCGMGITSFISHSKEIWNMTPGKYLNHLRLETAAQLLINNPNRSITDIAYDCGFASSQYFATVFKKQYGCNPVSFRDSQEK